MPLLAGVAEGRPRAEMQSIRLGFTETVDGSGCASTTFERAAPPGQALRLEPRVGSDVGESDVIRVTDARVDGGRAIWTLSPADFECSIHEDDPSWSWTTGEQAWSVTTRRSVLAIRTASRGGVTSIGGFRIRHTRRSAPTIAKARRYFGRPSSLRRRHGSWRVSCRAHWRRLGLTIDLLNLGGRNPCRHGFVQSGRVRGRSPWPWTAVVGRQLGVALGTTDSYLDAEYIGESGIDQRTWTLDEVYIPYGDGGFAPSLSALLDQHGRVNGFEFWVGAGGD